VVRLHPDFAIDYVTNLCYTKIRILAHEGRLRRRSCRRSEAWRPAAGGAKPQRGRSGTPPAGPYGPAAGRSLVGSGATAGDDGAGPRPKIATVERREGVPVATGRSVPRKRG